jgi:cyanuric acid amidohydrolase
MVAIELVKYPTTSPADTTPLIELEKSGYHREQILAIIGKTEGRLFLHFSFFTRCLPMR